jgi:hypothetical protein
MRLLILALALIFPLTAAAQQPSASAKTNSAAASETPSRAEVLRLFQVMRMQQQMEGIQKMMMAQMPAMLEETEEDQLKTLTPQQRQRLRDISNSSMQDAQKIYPISEMLDDFVPIYQHNLSKADVQRITAFYLSPAGKKLLNSNPKMMQEAMAVIAPKMQERMQKLIEEERRKADSIIDAPDQQQSPPPQHRH